MKKNQHQKSFDQSPFPDQFGLGIQVFKIQSNQVIDNPKLHPRKAIKEIQNPYLIKPTIPIPKKIPILQAIEKTEKYSKTGMSEAPIQRRAKTIEKKNIIDLSMKEILEKKIHEVKKPNLINPNEKSIENQQGKIEEKEMIQQCFLGGKQLIGFYEQQQKMELERAKEIRKMKRLKENEWTMEMKIRKEELLESASLISDIIEKRPFSAFQDTERYDEYDISMYLRSGFMRYDEQVI